MGTRCLTTVLDGETPLVTMYRQYDGHPGGHGAELVEAFGKADIVNGIREGARPGVTFNGAGCLAAWLVAHFKKATGGFYLHAPGIRGCGEEFHYTLTVNGSELGLKVEETNWDTGAATATLYDGPPSDYVPA